MQGSRKIRRREFSPEHVDIKVEPAAKVCVRHECICAMSGPSVYVLCQARVYMCTGSVCSIGKWAQFLCWFVFPCYVTKNQDTSIRDAIQNGLLAPVDSSFSNPLVRLAGLIMDAQVPLVHPDMSGKCPGCAGSCVSQSACVGLITINQKACEKRHCQACLLPLDRVRGVNMHPSKPGWRSCAFKYTEHVRKYLVLASRGVDINVTLPPGFPARKGPEAAIDWAFSVTRNGNPPNIVAFVAALLRLQ